MIFINDKLKQRFCKDCGISFSIYEEPVFSNRISLYDDLYSTKSKFDLFLSAMNKFVTEEDYFKAYNKLKDDAIDHIKSSLGYSTLNSVDMNTYACKNHIPSTCILKPSNDGRLFISIDMKKANFSALNFYSPSIFEVNGKYSKTWEEFISNFTDIDHIINSKYIRQVILGNCNPKRHITYEKYLMDLLTSELIEAGIENIVSMTNDEIVIDVTEENYVEGVLLAVNECVTKSPLPFKVTHFELVKAFDCCDSNAYFKLSLDSDNRIEIKGATPYEMPILLRTLKGEDITTSDRVFTFENQLCEFKTTPKIEEETLCRLNLK